MDFTFNEEQTIWREEVSKFVRKEIIPVASDIDSSNGFAADLMRKIGDAEFFGVRYPEEYGGAGADTTLYVIMMEEFGRGIVGIAAAVAMQTLMGTDLIYRYGTEEIKQKYLVPAIKGDKYGVIAFTEADAGTDLGNVRTTARLEGDSYILNGTKMWITNARDCHFFSILANKNPEKGIKGLTFFLVENGTPGLSIGKDIKKMGTRGTTNCEVILDNVKIPIEHLLDKDGRGIGVLFDILSETRLILSAIALGAARSCFDKALLYAKQRIAFGKPIAKHQLIQEKISEMGTLVDCCQLLTYKAAWLKDQGKQYAREAMIAKYHNTEAAIKIVNEAMRIFGAYGYAQEYAIEQYLRDIYSLLYAGGTAEILKVNIANHYIDKI